MGADDRRQVLSAGGLRLYDFHTHSFLSDGALSPVELVRRAVVCGYAVIAITDHAGACVEGLISHLRRECELAAAHWEILALPGVELTHVPPAAVPSLARAAKRAGAALVVVHGETVVEPVEPGTNRAAVTCEDVDVLAHPGLLTLEDARLAAESGCFLELSGRRGHSFANGHVVRLTRDAGATLLLNSDAHEPADLLTPDFALAVARGAGLDDDEAREVLQCHPRRLLKKLGLGAAEGLSDLHAGRRHGGQG